MLVAFTLDFLKSPSLLISDSGGGPMREGRVPSCSRSALGILGFSRFRNCASEKKLDLWATLPSHVLTCIFVGEFTNFKFVM